jgi:hypothetical protein
MLAAVRPQPNRVRRQQHVPLRASAGVNRSIAEGALM